LTFSKLALTQNMLRIDATLQLVIFFVNKSECFSVFVLNNKAEKWMKLKIRKGNSLCG
jgi:hypothetical protein